MEMKKLLALGLSVVALTTLGTLTAYADLVDNGDGTQTINNGTAPTVTDADVAITGYLGTDNTDPEIPEPGKPDEWINVTLPTKAIYNSDATKDHASIISPTHTIKNNSGRPVRVEVAGFTGSVGHVGTLSVHSAAGAATVEVIKDGALSTTPKGKLMELNSPATGTPTPFAGSSDTFNFTGTTDTSWATTHVPEKVNSTLQLKFTPLQPDGSDFAPAP